MTQHITDGINVCIFQDLLVHIQVCCYNFTKHMEVYKSDIHLSLTSDYLPTVIIFFILHKQRSLFYILHLTFMLFLSHLVATSSVLIVC